MPDIRRVMASHEERFERLFSTRVDAVRRYAIRRDPAAADDVVAETFAIAWRRLADVPDGERELAWLLAVARRVHANALRARRRRVALIDRIGADAAVAPPSHAAEDHGLREALARLADADRELLMLVYWDDLDHASAAVVLGTTRANVAVRLHRARQRLARELGRGRSPSVAAGAAVTREEGQHA